VSNLNGYARSVLPTLAHWKITAAPRGAPAIDVSK